MASRNIEQLTVVEQYAIRLVSDIRRNIDTRELPESLRPPARIIHYLIVVYHGHPGFRVSRIAPHLGVSLRTLERAFRKEFHTTMKAFQIRTRLKFAQTLLSSGSGVKMSVVAKELGYDDPNVFERFFHNQAGDSPFSWGRAEQERKSNDDPDGDPVS